MYMYMYVYSTTTANLNFLLAVSQHHHGSSHHSVHAIWRVRVGLQFGDRLLIKIENRVSQLLDASQLFQNFLGHLELESEFLVEALLLCCRHRLLQTLQMPLLHGVLHFCKQKRDIIDLSIDQLAIYGAVLCLG